MKLHIPRQLAAHSFYWDLGLRNLWRQRASVSRVKDFTLDLASGLTVACVAVPLSLAVALASGVKPEVGLITSIVAGVVCALLGGSTYTVSGPTAAMAILIASIVARFGMGGVLVAGMLCGIFQIVAGVMRFGRWVRFVPIPVIAGFSSGIGATMLVGQAPRILGLPAPEPAHACDVITHAGELIRNTNHAALGLASLSLLLVFFIPRLFKRIPAAPTAIVIPSTIAAYFKLSVETTGTIPSVLTSPSVPDFSLIDLGPLLGASLTVFALASLESILTASSLDKMSVGDRSDPDQELIGQGFGNVLVSLFGGIPGAGVLARSTLNYQAGAKTRRSAIIHSILLFAGVLFMAPLIAQIPVAVLAGLLFAVAIRMLNPREFIEIYKASRPDAGVYLITFVVTLSADLLSGIEAGFVASVIIAAIRIGQVRLQLHTQPGSDLHRLALDGPLTFLSSGTFEALINRISGIPNGSLLILDMTNVAFVDASGTQELVQLVLQLEKRQIKNVIQGVSPSVKAALTRADRSKHLTQRFATTEADAQRMLGGDSKQAARNRLLYGIELFHGKQLEPVFERLSLSQEPHTLLITCIDSRIDPNLITSTSPGEILVMRNIGNTIAEFDSHSFNNEGAAIEYAVGVLKVREIVVCAHSNCGALTAIHSSRVPEGLPTLRSWVTTVSGRNSDLSECFSVNDASKLNALKQVHNLFTYPIVKERARTDGLAVRAWFYSVETGAMEEWDDETGSFVEVGISQETRVLPS